ncbi:MAG: SMC-Scp complex subunit ScpB [Ignavibacteria bacterium]
METPGIKNIVEAILFASENEMTLKEIKDILDAMKIDITLTEIEQYINILNQEYDKNNNAFHIIDIAGGYQFATRKQYAGFIGKLHTEAHRKKLSPSALETLAIIAYKQPITRAEIEFIRGVNVDYIVNSLLERDLITIKGRAQGPGRPILYGTTNNFLKVLGLNSLDDLPRLREINEILKEDKIEGITEEDIDLFNSINYPKVTEPEDLLNKESNESQTQERTGATLLTLSYEEENAINATSTTSEQNNQPSGTNNNITEEKNNLENISGESNRKDE